MSLPLSSVSSKKTCTTNQSPTASPHQKTRPHLGLTLGSEGASSIPCSISLQAPQPQPRYLVTHEAQLQPQGSTCAPSPFPPPHTGISLYTSSGDIRVSHHPCKLLSPMAHQAPQLWQILRSFVYVFALGILVLATAIGTNLTEVLNHLTICVCSIENGGTFCPRCHTFQKVGSEMLTTMLLQAV